MHDTKYLQVILNQFLFLDSERSDECIDFTMVFFL